MNAYTDGHQILDFSSSGLHYESTGLTLKVFLMGEEVTSASVSLPNWQEVRS